MLVYLCGTKDDSVIVLCSAGSFFLLTTKTDGHWTEAVVYAEEILVFCEDSTKKKNTTVKNNNGSPALGQKSETNLGLK